MPTTSRNRQSSFLLSATVDFPDDVRYGPYSFELLDELMVQLRSLGVRRIYWLYYYDIDPDSDWADNIFQRMKYGEDTLRAIGEPLTAAVSRAHQLGMELYAVLKPYHTGTWGSYPEGTPEAEADEIKRIGETPVQAIPFVERHPYTRIRRRPLNAPPDLQSLPVQKIRLLKKDDSPTRIRKENLELWTSANNHRYQKRDVAFTLQEKVEPAPREVRDYWGNLVTTQGASVRTLTLEGLHLTDPYILITTNFKDEKGDFRNTALGMLEVYGPGPEPLPIVVATRSAIVRDSPRDFRSSGLAFDSGLGPLEVDLDVDNASNKEGPWWTRFVSGGAIAFAKGKNEYLVAACEVYPEVRQLWSVWVDRLIEAGVDGIDLRISAHGTYTDEPHSYGFNEPVLTEYRQRFGSDPLEDDAGLERLAQIRGEHYTSFVRETSHRLRKAGKKMQVHLHTEAFRPDPCPGQLMGFPANIHFDWKMWLNEGLVDGVTLRTSWFEALEDPPGQVDRCRLSKALTDALVEEVLNLTQELGLPVYLNRYIKLPIAIEEYVSDLESVFHDDRFAGLDVYEVAHVLRAAPDGSKLVPVENRLEVIRAKAGELQLT